MLESVGAGPQGGVHVTVVLRQWLVHAGASVYY